MTPSRDHNDPTRLPRVSVCIPTVDRPEMLREAIASVAAQTWKDFQVVLADNSAEPAMQAQIAQVVAAFPDLRFVVKRHSPRLDPIANFNSLIEEGRSDLWACLTDDDRLCPDFLSRSVQALDRHPECSFTFSDHWIMNEAGVLDETATRSSSLQFGRTGLSEGVYAHDRLFEVALKQSMCLQTALFRRSVIASARFLPGIISGDLSLFLRLAASPDKHSAYYIASRLFEYRIHGSQLSTTTSRKALLQAQIAALESTGNVPARHRRHFNKKLGGAYLALSLIEAEEGDRERARSHALSCLRLTAGFREIAGSLIVTLVPSGIGQIRRLRNQWNAASISSP